MGTQTSGCATNNNQQNINIDCDTESKTEDAVKVSCEPSMNRLRTVWITESNANHQFSSQYTKIKQIGESGAYGTAWQCRRNSDGKIFAVKEISKARIYRLDPSNRARKRFLRAMKAEIDIMRRLKHKYIVNMDETYETKHHLYIVMEECKGGELFARIKDRQRYHEDDAKPVIAMICKALFYMHDKHKVVHGDLKPDNILFTSDNEEADIKIIDFGMSQICKVKQTLSSLCGTPYYTAPEVIKGNYSHAADMWSLGVITYTMSFGFPPFYVKQQKYYGINEKREIYKKVLKGFNPKVKRGYGPWFPKSLSDNLSASGLDFIKRLLVSNVKKRMTVQQALQHPWLKDIVLTLDNDTLILQETKTDDDDDVEHKNNDLVGLDMHQFASFSVAHQFKSAISLLFREQYKHMTPKHFKNLNNLFMSLDKDKNGKILYKEFEQVIINKCEDLNLDKDRIRQIFSELDINKEGEIEFRNLLDAAVHDFIIAADARLYTAFRDVDGNDNGKICVDILKKKICELNPYGCSNIKMILQIVDDVDVDNDGNINYEEFLKVLHPNFNEPPNWFWDDNNHNVSRSGSMSVSDNCEDIIENSMQENTESKTQDDIANIIMNADAYSIQNNDNDNSTSTDEAVESMDEYKKDTNTNSTNSTNSIRIVKQGYMTKQGKLIKSWKKRWFVLSNNGMMSYYKNKNDTEPISRFNVKHLTKLMYKSWGKTNKKRYGIKIYTPNRNWRFSCQHNDRSEWMAAIQNVSGYIGKTSV